MKAVKIRNFGFIKIGPGTFCLAKESFARPVGIVIMFDPLREKMPTERDAQGNQEHYGGNADRKATAVQRSLLARKEASHPNDHRRKVRASQRIAQAGRTSPRQFRVLWLFRRSLPTVQPAIGRQKMTFPRPGVSSRNGYETCSNVSPLTTGEN